MIIELTEEDILCELQALAKCIATNDDFASAEKYAKKICWLVELWEDYKK